MLTRKQVEQSASEICLRSLGYLPAAVLDDNYTIQPYKGGHSNALSGKKGTQNKAISALLQVVNSQIGLQFPEYGIQEEFNCGEFFFVQIPNSQVFQS